MKLACLALAAALALPGIAQAPKKEKQDKKAPVAAPAPKADPKPAAAPAAGGFVGNKDSKTFHKADCKTATKMKAENRVSFASKAEAEKAGMKACKVCKP